jgi:hypothetical protein
MPGYTAELYLQYNIETILKNQVRRLYNIEDPAFLRRTIGLNYPMGGILKRSLGMAVSMSAMPP